MKKTIFLLIFFLVALSSSVFADLPPIANVSLAITCDADERNATYVYDSSSKGYNGEYKSSVKFVTGIIGEACNFTGYADAQNRIEFGFHEEISFNTDTATNGNCISWIGRLGTVTAALDSRHWFANGDTGNCVYANDASNYWYARAGGNTYALTAQLKEQSVGWSHFVWCFRANKRQLWVNGSAYSNNTNNYVYTTDENFYLGNRHGGQRGLDGQMDEITIFYNTFLVGDQVQSLYEALFNGYGYKDGWQLVNVVLGGVVNGSRHNTLIENNLSFNVTVSDSFLYGNCTLQKFNSSGFKIQDVDTFNYSISQLFWVNDTNFSSSTEQQFLYNVLCSIGGTTGLSNNISVFIDNVNPSITFTSNQINEDNTSSVFGASASFNISFFDTYLYRTRINVSTPTNNTVYFNDSGVLSGSDTNYLVNATFLLNDVEETYNIFLVATDTHTKKKIKQYDFFLDNVNKKHNYVTEYNNVISVKLLNNKEETLNLISRKEVDRHIFGYHFSDKKQKILDIQVFCDNNLHFLSKSKFAAHFICEENGGFGGNWIDFEGHKVLNVRKLDNNNYVVKIKVLGDYVEFNSLGGLNVVNKTITFQRRIINHSFYFSDPIIYSDITVINQSMIMEVLGVYGDNNPIANITFNGTVYNAIKRTNTTPNNFNFSFIVNLPTINTSLFNDTFNFWGNYSFNGYYYGSNIQQQFLYIPSVFVCNSLSDDRILNLTYRDEISNNIIVANNSYNLDFTDNFINYSFVDSFVNNRSSEYCTNIRPTESYNWGYSGTFTLSKPNYITRIITIPVLPLTIASNNPITYRDLFLIPVNDSSTITFTWQTNEFQYIDGTMIIYKCNANGSRSIVESTAIISGEAIANLQLLFTPYSYEIIIDGKVYTNPGGWSSCHVESSTTRSFFVDTSRVNVLPVVGLYFVDCTLQKIDNDTVSMRWNSNEQDSSYVEGCLITKKMQLNGYIETAKSCVNASSGNFTRDVTGEGNFLVVGEITQNGYKGYCKDQISFYTKSEFLDSSGPLTLFGVVLLIMSLVGMYSAKGEKMVIATAFGLIVSFFLGVLAFPWEIVFSLICFLLIIVLIGRYARKKF